MTKLLILDDSELIRARLMDLLKEIPGLPAIEETGTLAQTLDCVERCQPAMAILDLHLPDGDSLQILPTLKRIAPDMQIAMLTNDATEFNRTKCLQAGANWFFDKSTEYELVLELIQKEMVLH